MVEKQLEKKIASELRSAGFVVERQPIMSGLRPDMLVTTPDNRRFVIEVKAWRVPAQDLRLGLQIKQSTTGTYWMQTHRLSF